MAAATSNPPQLSGPVGALNLLPSIDMTTLSQSELRALSVCSASSHAASGTGEIVIPAIDRSIFNESTGSRRQTYSRPSPHHHHHRHRLAGVLPKLAAAAPPVSSTASEYLHDPANDPDRPENLSIIRFLKQFLSTHPDFQQQELDIFSHFNNPVDLVSPASPKRKRKRGRKPKAKVLVNREPKEDKFVEQLEMVNKNGAVVDLAELASLEDPFSEELTRRTLGMTKEEELLGFLRDLEGEWCSRRRKRKFVDAGEFGDALPLGWKLLLGLKRKEGRAWVYCRRLVSPGGQHFLSCKEVSEYMQSVCGGHVVAPPLGKVSMQQQDNRMIFVRNREMADGKVPSKSDKELGLEMDNLAEVQIHDLFECRKCKLTFDERGLYLSHLLSYHQRTTRKYRLGSSVGDGVIVKDGKYECQFCHKVFHERRRYNGHVGIHVRNYVRGVEESPAERMAALQKPTESPVEDELPSAARISKMDALVEIAQNSILEASSSVANHENNDRLTSDIISNVVISVPASALGGEVTDGNSPMHDVEMDDGMKEGSPEDDIHLQKKDGPVGPHEADDAKNDEVHNQKKAVEMAVGSVGIEGTTTAELAALRTAKDEPTMLMMLPPPDVFSTESTVIATLDKEDKGIDEAHRRQDKVAEMEGLRVEDMEVVGYGTEQQEPFVHEAEMGSMCGVSEVLDSELGSSRVHRPEELPTMCNWCGVEFGYPSSSDTGSQSGSAGYMCPSCKLEVAMEAMDGDREK
ncbi:unnamed protein product [Linum tenue]|uniref:C2H2-type domain-containing protein n=1 Tax=Linum tenue TaxID=586396 RepID=A0AAV0KW86_9ROSI|nr:unnamed protein product [Linum tenue]